MLVAAAMGFVGGCMVAAGILVDAVGPHPVSPEPPRSLDDARARLEDIEVRLAELRQRRAEARVRRVRYRVRWHPRAGDRRVERDRSGAVVRVRVWPGSGSAWAGWSSPHTEAGGSVDWEAA